MELKAILFDLDNTLLQYPTGSDLFSEKAFGLMVEYLAQWIAPDRAVPALEKAWEAMDANNGSEFTNEEIFIQSFGNTLELDTSNTISLHKWENVFEKYYTEVFVKLKDLTRPMSGARIAIEWAFNNGLQVAIATGTHGLQILHKQRLEWVGIPSSEFNYALITSMGNMHASKPYVAYYEEVLNYIGRNAQNCLMIGDMWEDDIVPATSVGIYGYWFTEDKSEPPENIELLVGYGDMGDFLGYLQSLDI